MKKVFQGISCSIYWWNHGKKTKDHVGNVWEYFKKRGIKVNHTKTPWGTSRYRFTIYTSSTAATLITHSSPEIAALEAIKVFLSMMGDKAQVQIQYRTAEKINWR